MPDTLADRVVQAVEFYVSKAAQATDVKISALDQRIKDIPIPKDGKDASPEQIREAVSLEVADAMSGLTNALIAKFTQVTHAS